MKNISISEMKTLLADLGTALENLAKDDELVARTAEFGMTKDVLSEYEQKRQTGEKLYTLTGPKSGVKISTGMRLREKIDEIHAVSMIYIKWLRRDLRKTPDLLREFNLVGKRDHTFGGKIIGAKEFYQDCIDNTKLGQHAIKCGLTAEMLQSRLQAIEDVVQDKNYKAVVTMEKEENTARRNQVIEELDDIWRALQDVLRYVLKDDRHKLEAYRIKAYSEGYKPKPKTKKSEEPAPQTGEENEENENGEVTEDPQHRCTTCC